MKRSVMVRQDEVVELRNGGELAIVSEQALARELVTWAAIVHRMGGHFRVTTHRMRNPDLPSEAFTVGAMVEWIDRTDDVRDSPEQELNAPGISPAPASLDPVLPDPPSEPVDDTPATPHPSALMREDEDPDELAAAARAAYEADEEGIVRDAAGEPEEDLTSIPAVHR